MQVRRCSLRCAFCSILWARVLHELGNKRKLLSEFKQSYIFSKRYGCRNGFYRKLGFLQIVDTAHYARFECPGGGSAFSLVLDESQFNNGAIIYFEHKNLDHWVCQLIGKGIVFEKMLDGMSYLWREAVLYDPSGNKIKLYCAGENLLNPPWRVECSD